MAPWQKKDHQRIWKKRTGVYTHNGKTADRKPELETCVKKEKEVVQ